MNAASSHYPGPRGAEHMQPIVSREFHVRDRVLVTYCPDNRLCDQFNGPATIVDEDYLPGKDGFAKVEFDSGIWGTFHKSCFEHLLPDPEPETILEAVTTLKEWIS